MTNELSIKSIKEELMDAFLNNVQIINSFNKYDDIKKTTDYINRNIFNHLNTEEDYTKTDKFINFDVTYERDSYRVIIIVKAHRSLVNSKDNVNCLDDMCSSIKEIVDEICPYYECYFDRPIRRGDYYVERQIGFTLYESYRRNWLEEHVKTSKDNAENSISVDVKGNVTIKANNITIEGATI